VTLEHAAGRYEELGSSSERVLGAGGQCWRRMRCPRRSGTRTKRRTRTRRSLLPRTMGRNCLFTLRRLTPGRPCSRTEIPRPYRVSKPDGGGGLPRRRRPMVDQDGAGMTIPSAAGRRTARGGGALGSGGRERSPRACSRSRSDRGACSSRPVSSLNRWRGRHARNRRACRPALGCGQLVASRPGSRRAHRRLLGVRQRNSPPGQRLGRA